MSVAPRQGVQIFAGAGRMRWTPGDREGKSRLSGSWWLQRRRRGPALIALLRRRRRDPADTSSSVAQLPQLSRETRRLSDGRVDGVEAVRHCVDAIAATTSS